MRRGAPNTFVVGDMPFLSYQTLTRDAAYNARRFLKEASMDAVKLEGGVRVTSQSQAITDAGVVVIGHIGLIPQRSGQLGGHKAQGRTAESAKLLVEDALGVEKAGAGMLLVEAVPPEVTRYIVEELTIPALSVAAGPHCHGQLLIASSTSVNLIVTCHRSSCRSTPMKIASPGCSTVSGRLIPNLLSLVWTGIIDSREGLFIA